METAALKPFLSLLGMAALACTLSLGAKAAPEPAASATATSPAPTGTASTGTASTGGKARREPSPARLAQQERMRGCNATARERSLSGEARKEFMRGCLRKS